MNFSILFGPFLSLVAISSCLNTTNSNIVTEQTPEKIQTLEIVNKEKSLKLRHFEGPISNGMKGDSLFFDVSADGTKLENLTFKGYWRCDGVLEQTTVGPDGDYQIANGKVGGHISEPPNGGATAWRFEVNAEIKESSASGTFRMNINALGCDTYKLEWTAVTVSKK